MTATIALVTDPAPCLALRLKVFVEEQGFAAEGELDALDRDAEHLLAVLQGRPVGTARLIDEGEAGRIGRICVLPEARGRGLGAALVRAGLVRFAERGKARVVLGAQQRAAGFYEKLGFVVCGPVYDDEGVPHHDMERAPGGAAPQA